jgi:hypothetical protein
MKFEFGLKRLPEKGRASKKLKSIFALNPIVPVAISVPEEEAILTFELIPTLTPILCQDFIDNFPEYWLENWIDEGAFMAAIYYYEGETDIGVPGITIALYDESLYPDGFITSEVTDEDGNVTFSGITEGCYTAVVTGPGWEYIQQMCFGEFGNVVQIEPYTIIETINVEGDLQGEDITWSIDTSLDVTIMESDKEHIKLKVQVCFGTDPKEIKVTATVNGNDTELIIPVTCATLG